MIDIDKFCGKQDIRSYLHSPTVHEGYMYASNGHIAIRVPSSLANTPNPSDIFIRSIVKIFADVDAKITGGGDKIPDVSHVEKETDCPHCSGVAGGKECGSCNGDGEFEHYGQDYDCKTCDGDGKIVCEYCDGIGKIINTDPINIGTAFFSTKYLHLLSELPRVRIHVQSEFATAFFTFDGGVGALMPVRK